MEAAFVLARCFPISCSRGAAYTGLHRLAVATQASCFGGLLYGSLQFHFFSFRYFVALCIIFLDFFDGYLLYMFMDQFMPLFGHISPFLTQLFVHF